MALSFVARESVSESGQGIAGSSGLAGLLKQGSGLGFNARGLENAIVIHTDFGCCVKMD